MELKVELQMAYDAYMKARRDRRAKIREEEKVEYRQRYNARCEAELEPLDYEFALRLKAAKDAGLRRFELAEAIRTNDNRKMRYFLDLAGAGGFQRGRPTLSVEEKVKRDVGVEILDAGAGFIRVHEMRGVAVEPFEAVVYRRGSDVRIDPPEGVERFEQEAYDVYNSDVDDSIGWLHRVMEVVEESRG